MIECKNQLKINFFKENKDFITKTHIFTCFQVKENTRPLD